MKTANTFEPLGLRTHLEDATEAPLNLFWVAFFNVLLVAFGIFLSSSKWLCPPGVQFYLPKMTSGLAYNTAIPSEETLIVDEASRIFFQRKLYTFEQLDTLFSEKPKNEGLILEVDRQIPIEKVLRLMEKARSSGYKFIQIAVSVL